MRISDLQAKDVVTIEGKKIGRIIDMEIDEAGVINYFVVEPPKLLRGFLITFKETTVVFDQIKTIGEDVILVEKVL